MSKQPGPVLRETLCAQTHEVCLGERLAQTRPRRPALSLETLPRGHLPGGLPGLQEHGPDDSHDLLGDSSAAAPFKESPRNPDKLDRQEWFQQRPEDEIFFA